MIKAKKAGFFVITTKQKSPAYEKKLYAKILKKLRSTYSEPLKGHSLRRVKKLAGFICGMILKKRSTMSALGSGLPQYITAHSKEKACKQFLDNDWNDYQTHYLPYITHYLPLFIEQASSGDSVYFVIDGSQVGNAHVALMVSLVYKNRSLPINWLVKKGGKGHFTTQMHLDLLQQVYGQVKTLLPKDKSVTLLGDGEFDSIGIQLFCRKNGWNYVLRTASNTVMYEGNERFQPKNLEISAQQNYLFVPEVDFTEQRLKKVNFLYWHELKYDQPISLVSNLSEPIDIMNAYDKRYAIECLFKDLKTTSFNLHKTRLTDAFAISNLIMVAAFAFTLLIKLATKYEKSEIRKRLHRIRPDRIVCSVFFFALELISFLLEEDLQFNFDFYKHSMNFP